MSINNYGTLKTAIANWLERDDLVSRIPEFITLAEDRMDQKLRIRLMEHTVDLTISAQETALPTGFVSQRRLYIDTPLKALEYYPPEDFWIRNAVNQTAQPKLYTIEGDNIMVAPTPDTTYTGKILYYRTITGGLTEDDDTNLILANTRGLYLYGALMEAAMFIEDEAGAIKWSIRFDNLIEEVADADRDDRFPLGSLQQRSLMAVT